MSKSILKKVMLIALAVLLFNSVFEISNHQSPQKPKLKFNSSGKFKIVQFTDLHECPLKNEKTIKLMEDTLNFEKPDLVVLTGDNISGKHLSKDDAKKAISNIAKPMEDRKIPWAVIFGNHDSELCSLNRKDQMKVYMSYKHNISQKFSYAKRRIGDYNILIKDSKCKKIIFNIYMLDSGEYCHDDCGYIKDEQINWYKNLSTNLRKKCGRPVPSLMFFHIPLKCQYNVWKSGNAIGDRNEEECSQNGNVELLSALSKMGDVKGIFVGHDHTNDYVGSINNIILGYGRCSGYNGYGDENFLRGARIFILDENNPNAFETYEKLE